MANPAETAYLSFRDRDLSNDVSLVEFRQRKVVVHTFLWVVPGHCLHAGFMESRNFFVLRPIRVKFYIRTRLIERFLSTFRSLCCAEEKLHFTPFHTLRQLKRDEALIPPFWRVVEFRAEVRLGNCTQVWGWAKFEERGIHG